MAKQPQQRVNEVLDSGTDTLDSRKSARLAQYNEMPEKMERLTKV